MYEWIKAGHIISLIAWMAAMLYLPRLMVYHADTEIGSQRSETFKIMERRLMRAIMTPSMLSTWLFGLWLVFLTEAWRFGWFHAKFVLVLLLTAFHGFCVRWVREYEADQRRRDARFFRWVNEMPALIMVFVVILAVVKPF
jgi:protoporphyrinogen IX oxidase